MGILQGLVLVSMLVLCVTSQQYSSRHANHSGHREDHSGDVLNTSDVDDQVVFHTDHSGHGHGGGSGDHSGHGHGGGSSDHSGHGHGGGSSGNVGELDCEMILRECPCQRFNPPVPTVLQSDYDWDD